MKKILQWMFLLMLMSTIGSIHAHSFNYDCESGATDVASTTSTISWTETSTFSALNLGYSPTEILRGLNTIINDVYMENVDAATKHCSVMIESPSTECDVMNLPSFENFESYSENSFPSCWYNRSGDGNMVYQPYNATKCMRLKHNGIVCTPQYNIPANESGIYFQAKASSSYSSGVLEVGYVTDTVLWDYVELKTIVATDTKFHWHEVSLEDVNSTDPCFIVFSQVGSQSDYSYWYFDDVTMFQLGTCRSPKNFTFTGITATTATLNWDCMSEGANFEIEVSGDTILNVNTINGERSYTLNNLTPNTIYTVRIRTVCSVSDSSNWIDMGGFATDPSCAKLSNLNISSVTESSAVVNWLYANMGSSHSGVYLRYRCTSDATNSEWVVANVTGNSYFMTGLSAGQSYVVEASVVCGTDTSSLTRVSFVTPSGICGEVVGNGIATTMRNPYSNNYNYSYTQAIYDGLSVVGMDTIKGIVYHSESGIDTRTWVLYMANTTKDAFDNGSDYLLASELTQVFSGSVSFTGGWDTILFTTPFVTNGTDNLVVAVEDSTGDYSAGAPDFFSHRGSALYKHSDSAIPTASNVTSMTTTSDVADIRFIGDCVPITCKAPSVACATADVTSISIAWLPGLNESSWSVEYRMVGSEMWNMAVASTMDTMVTISDLLGSTAYEIRVGALCSGETQYGYTSAYTACGSMELPMYESFVTNTMNPCWKVGNCNLGSRTVPTVAGKKLNLESNTFVILPQVSVDINTLELRFKMNDEDGVGKLYVGTVSEQNNISTFVPIDTVYTNPIFPNSEIIIPLDSYNGSDQYIALVSGTKAIVVDDLVVEEIPACPQPLNLDVTSLGGTTLSMKWDASATANSWNVVVVPTGNDISTGSVISVEENSVVLTDLTYNTTYDIYVSAACSEGSSLNTLLTITTLATDPIIIPYMTDFTDAENNDKWTSYSPGGFVNKWIIGTSVSNGTENGLYISMDNGVSNNYNGDIEGIAIAYIPIQIAEDGKYVLSYDWIGKGETDYDFGRVALVAAPYNFNTISTDVDNYSSELPINWIAMDGGPLGLQTTWTSHTEKRYLTAGTYFLTVFWTNDQMYAEVPALSIDNISLDYATCTEPTGIFVSRITETSATVSWDYDENATNGWEVWIDNEIPNQTMDTSFTFTNLTASSNYTVNVRTMCSEEDKSLVVTKNFFTLCSDITTLPYYTDFNAESPAITDADPHCWTISTDGYPSVSTEYSETPSLHFYCRESNGYHANVASLPKLGDNINLSELELQFDIKTDYYSSENILYVGVCTTAGDLTTFTPIDTIDGISEDWSTYIVSLANYTGTGKYVTVYAATVRSYDVVSMMMDNVWLQRTSPCNRPTTAYVDSYTHNSALINWIDNNDVATFKLAYSTMNDLTTAENVITDIDSAPYTITGLESSTTYYVWVAAECSLMDTVSSWVSAGQFTTNPSCASVTDLQVIDIDATRATLTWRAPAIGEDVTSYIVQYQMNMNAPVVDTVEVPYYFLSNLLEDSTYIASVTTVCNTTVSTANSTTFVPAASTDCATLGTGAEDITGCPIHGLYNFGFAQMMFKADELLEMGDTIRGVTFNGTSAYPSSRTIKVYMYETSLSAFGPNFMPVSQMTLVYDGAWIVGSGLSPIDFTTEFVRTDRSKNIVLTVDDNSGTYNGAVDFVATEYNEDLVIYSYKDEFDITDATLPSKTNTLRPNVIFDADCVPQSCFAPSVVISNVSDTQIDIAWRVGNDESAWKVEYHAEGDDVWTVAQSNTTLTNASLTNLIPGQVYYIRVGSICGSEVVYRTINVATLCGPMPMPFYEDFESSNQGAFEKICWTPGGAYYPEVSNEIGNGNVLALVDNAYIVLPKMDGALNTLQIRLRYLASADSIWTSVGYIENPNEIGSFHALDTIYDYNNVRGYYHTIRYNGIPANADGYIAIYTPHAIDYTFIDDIIVEPIRACVEPTNVAISNVTSHSIDVTWSGSASSYMVEYGPIRFEQGHGSRTIVNSTNAHLTGLDAGTMYDVYVHAICGAGDTSYASNVVSATTECAPLTSLPYVMNFEEGYLPAVGETGMLPLCWNSYITDILATEDGIPQIIYDRNGQYVVNGQYVLRMKNSSTVVMPEMSNSLNTLCVRFNAQMKNISSRLVVGVVNHVDAGFESTFTPIDTIAPINVNCQERYVVFLDSYGGDSKYIAFRNVDTDPLETTSIIYLDSIVVDVLPTCPEVSDIETITATASSITIDWNNHNDNAIGWEIEYGEKGFELGEGTRISVTSHPTTITNLETLTQYDIWIRPICGVGDTGFFGYRPYVATTDVCDVTIAAGTSPNGVTGISNDFPVSLYWNHSYSQTIIDAEYLASQTDIIAFSFNDAMPSSGKVNGCRVWMGHTNKTQFDGITDWVDADSLKLVYTGDFVYEAGPATILLDSAFSYDGTSNLIIAIDHDDNTYQGGHDIDIVSDVVAKTIYHSADYKDQDPYNPTYDGTLANSHTAFRFISCGAFCSVPMLDEVTDLTYESATINWTGDGNDYEVFVRTQDETAMPEAISVNGNSYTFVGLIPNVDYAYFVRQVCDSTIDLYSDWVEGSFTTEDIPCEVPTNVSVVSYTAESVDISWTAAEGQSKWTVHVFNTIEDFFDTVTVTSASIIGLTGGQTYNIAVNSICAMNYASEWSDTIEVTTTDCVPVSGVSISEITANSAKVSWTAGADESSWEINYGEDGFGQGQGIFVNATTTSYVLTGLESETPYDVYVRAICAEDFSSIWSNVVKFETTAGGAEGIDGVEGQFNFVIYPNPTSGATTISLNGIEGKVTISVVDMNGRRVTSESIECGSDCEKRIDVTGLAQGTYFVRVLGDSINSVRKLIVR